MTPTRLRPALALSLALGLLACDEGVDSPQRFRQGDLSAASTTVELRYELGNVLVTSYQLGATLEDALIGGGSDLLLGGSDTPLDDGVLALRVEGVAPIAALPVEGGTVVLRRGDEAVEVPVAPRSLALSIDSHGRAITELVLAEQPDAEAGDYAVWRDDFGTTSAAAEPVESVEYELVAVDGTTTTCSTALMPMESLSLNYSKIQRAPATLSLHLPEECASVLEEAADRHPPAAFFVRCDGATTTAVVGLQEIETLTLERGTLDATGQAALALSAE